MTGDTVLTALVWALALVACTLIICGTVLIYNKAWPRR